MQNTEDVKVS